MNQTLRYTAKKILWTIPILVGITFLAFGLGLVARGDPATNRASADPNYIPTEEEIQELRAEMGLDDPILVQYGRWIWNAAHGDLGESYIDDKPVLGEILRLLPNTLLLSGMALLVITVVGLAGGLLLTLFRDKFIDLLGRVLLVFLMSIPGFCLAYFMIWLFAQKLRILPTSGAETLSCFLMRPVWLFPSAQINVPIYPAACSSILGELSKNYILTAQAKGLRRGQLISRHAVSVSVVHISPIPLAVFWEAP